MSFDSEGHVLLSPTDIQKMAASDPVHLINFYLMRGTPLAFKRYADFCAFLNDVSSRIGVHPNNLFLRGSCHLGYSIAPNAKVWSAMDTKAKPSDLDLVIVDVDYFNRLNRELLEHDQINSTHYFQKSSQQYLHSLQDRQFNLCRDDNMPTVTCVHHKDTMRSVHVATYCSVQRDLSAFIFRDWMSARCRYQYDLTELLTGIRDGNLLPAPSQPVGIPASSSSSGSVPANSQQVPPASPKAQTLKT